MPVIAKGIYVLPGKCFIFVFLLTLLLLPYSRCSFGEHSDLFQKCVYWCSVKNCSNSSALANFKEKQPWYLSALAWGCGDECEYSCMWYAVQALQKRGYPVPQFHGKWPFIRLFGMQEPASVAFSVMNGISHIVMWIKFKKCVPHVSFFHIWNIHAMLSVNAWIWSTVFHTRDTPITEKLDYYCAFSLVLHSFYSLVVKILTSRKNHSSLAVAVPFISYFVYHIYYLTFVKFDYGYNMKVNIVVGLLNSIGWLLWCYKCRCIRPYVWKCAMSVVIVNLLLLLELGDFPPWGFVIDAHALWHLGTIPVPFLWYSFLIEDCLYEEKFGKLL